MYSSSFDGTNSQTKVIVLLCFLNIGNISCFLKSWSKLSIIWRFRKFYNMSWISITEIRVQERQFGKNAFKIIRIQNVEMLKKKHFLAFRIQKRPYDIKCFVCEPKIRIHERKSKRSSQALLRKMLEQYGFYSVISIGIANKILKQKMIYFYRINEFY